MTNAPHQPPAGWYPDPAGSDGERYWDGIAWSQATRDKVAAEVAPQPQPQVPTYGQPPLADTGLAPFGRRLGGFVLDFIIVYILATVVFALTGVDQRMAGEMQRWLDALALWAEGNGAGQIPMPATALWTALAVASLINIAIYAIYRTVLLGTMSATLGQLALGLRTVKVGEPVTSKLGWGTAAVRGIVGAILYQHLVIGFVNGIFAAFTSNRQTLSDMISRTQVLRTR
ncbi:RDD family protein [Tessaracoccus sp. HDW20]|uniref:RDD family protein n=1 Tax=Tessaracoccus coleopterorum TaxID=2714950 RepID=UPI0018D32896|nr:RDD family protein [Tessaracoccus coleopterorum]NHB85696.1 RDD family protein [Tessaracoccus coleopterorum]